MNTDTPRDREQTRRFLIKTAQDTLKGVPLRTNMIEELVNDVMKGGSFIDAVNSLVDDCHYWNQ